MQESAAAAAIREVAALREEVHSLTAAAQRDQDLLAHQRREVRLAGATLEAE